MVAIILVNYNGYEDTIECIKSLKNITDVEYKIIVVDNYSTDDSAIKLEKDKDIYDFILIKACQNNGFSAGNNIGINYAKNLNVDYYLLLNNDTVVENDFLKKLIVPFKNNTDVGITTSRILYFLDNNKLWYNGGNIDYKARIIHYDFNRTYRKTENEYNRIVSFASGCCMCISKECLNKVGMLDEDFFLYEEDSEYCCRAKKNNYKILFVPDSVIYHKVSSSTGKNSPMSQYYSIRNKYLLIKKSFKGINKIIAYLFCSLQFTKRCLTGEYKFKWLKNAIKAFLKHETGKSERIFK